MDKESIGKPILFAIIFGILGFIVGKLLVATAIFPIANIEYIGLLLGFLYGIFKDSL